MKKKITLIVIITTCFILQSCNKSKESVLSEKSNSDNEIVEKDSIYLKNFSDNVGKTDLVDKQGFPLIYTVKMEQTDSIVVLEEKVTKPLPNAYINSSILQLIVEKVDMVCLINNVIEKKIPLVIQSYRVKEFKDDHYFADGMSDPKGVFCPTYNSREQFKEEIDAVTRLTIAFSDAETMNHMSQQESDAIRNEWKIKILNLIKKSKIIECRTIHDFDKLKTTKL